MALVLLLVFGLFLIETYGESFAGAIAVGWSVVCFGFGHGVPVRLWLLVRLRDLEWRMVGVGYLRVCISDRFAAIKDGGKGRGDDDSFDGGGAFLDRFENPRSTNDSYAKTVR